MMKYINLWVLIVVVGSVICGAKQLPSYIQRCKRANLIERNKCIMERIEDIKPHLIEGIPELNLSRLEPLRVPKVEVRLGNNMALEFTIVLTDTDFYGVKNFQVKELNFDLENGNLFIHIYIPSFEAEGKYVAKGKISLILLDTAGTGQVNLTEIYIKVNRKLSIVTKNGKEYGNLEKDHDLKITYATINLHFDNLIKNNKELTEQANKVINDNYYEIGKQVDYIVAEGVHSAIYGILQTFFNEYSLDELFE